MMYQDQDAFDYEQKHNRYAEAATREWRSMPWPGTLPARRTVTEAERREAFDAIRRGDSVDPLTWQGIEQLSSWTRVLEPRQAKELTNGYVAGLLSTDLPEQPDPASERTYLTALHTVCPLLPVRSREFCRVLLRDEPRQGSSRVPRRWAQPDQLPCAGHGCCFFGE